jgi:hypothetical protein
VNNGLKWEEQRPLFPIHRVLNTPPLTKTNGRLVFMNGRINKTLKQRTGRAEDICERLCNLD